VLDEPDEVLDDAGEELDDAGAAGADVVVDEVLLVADDPDVVLLVADAPAVTGSFVVRPPLPPDRASLR